MNPHPNFHRTRLIQLAGTALLISLASYAQASDRLIVKFKEATGNGRVQSLEDRRSQALSVMLSNVRDAQWVRASDVDTHIFRYSPNSSPAEREAQLNRLKSDSRIAFAVPDRRVNTNATSNDPFLEDQWYLGTRAQGAARFTSAWDTFRGSARTVVAVVDTGVLPDHPELRNRVLPGYDFVTQASTANDGNGRDNDPSDPGNWVTESDLSREEFKECDKSNSSWHGTFVAGLIAGNTNDRVGTAGANWNARLLPVRALGKCGGFLSDVMDGARWAAGINLPNMPANPNPAVIINLSLGSVGACTEFEQNAVNEIIARNAVIVAAAGNKAGQIDSPASCSGVIAVGALDADGRRAAYSALGDRMTLMAPGGGDVTMVGPGNRGTQGPTENAYFLKRGTSFAAPMVSAALALAHGLRGNLNTADARDLLRRSVRPFPLENGETQCTATIGNTKCACTTSVCGSGMLDAANLMTLARNTRVVANAEASSLPDGAWLLDSGASSTANGRAVVSHRWVQIGGPSLSLTNTGVPGQTRTSRPSAAGEYLFQVTVEDSAGESHQMTISRLVGSAGLSSPPDAGNGSGGTTTATGGNNGVGSDNETNAKTGSGSSGGGGGALPAEGLAALLSGLWLLRGSQRQKQYQVSGVNRG